MCTGKVCDPLEPTALVHVSCYSKPCHLINLLENRGMSSKVRKYIFQSILSPNAYLVKMRG